MSFKFYIGKTYGGRVRTGHGNPGKSWNLEFYFPGLEIHGILIRVMESHGKLVQFA